MSPTTTGADLVSSPALVVLVMIPVCTSAKPSGAFGEQDLYSWVLEDRWHAQGPHSMVSAREWGEGGPGALPLLGSEGGVVFHRLTLHW